MKTLKAPVILRFFLPILETLQEMGGSGRAADVSDRIIEKLKISEQEQQAQNKNGASKILNQIAWARLYLVEAGYLDRAVHGRWQLTPAGMKLKLESFDAQKCLNEARNSFRKGKKDDSGTAENQEKGLEVLPVEDDLAIDIPPLLQELYKLSPKGFERVCLRLLDAAGIRRLQATGRPSDKGIDGEGRVELNPFVSEPVIFQCKRYKGSVSSAEVRNFRGAMAGRTDKGIIISTGTFTAEAQKEADRSGVSEIRLIDGNKLVEMFRQYNLGLRQVEVIDQEFFDSIDR